MWTGGRPMLGYNALDKRLVVNEVEAVQVRQIFKLFLKLESTMAVVTELRRRGWKSKTGKAHDKSSVHRLLTSVIYIGKVNYMGTTYPGAHDGIVDEKTWRAVQRRFKAAGGNGGVNLRGNTSALLRGLMRCGSCGSLMTPHYSQKNGRRYSSYVCVKYQKQGAVACPGSRVPQQAIEECVVARALTAASFFCCSVRSIAAKRSESSMLL